MQVLQNEFIVCYDVDNTLITRDYNSAWDLENPLTGSRLNFRINHAHVDLLKSHSKRGYYVRVWSAAGYRWAEAVVKALGLEEYVCSIETKPSLLVDDLPVQEIFPARVFIKEKE